MRLILQADAGIVSVESITSSNLGVLLYIRYIKNILT